jgi:uncharacterized membrane protein YiaA
MKFTKEELTNIINLLFTGKWNLSLQESQQIITPIINKISIQITELNKSNEVDTNGTIKK